MVSVTVPVAALLPAVIVKVLEEVALVGLKVAVTPDGSPAMERLTDPLKPFTGFTLMVLDPAFPCVMARLGGEAESEKSGTAAAFTVRVSVVVCVSVPETP